MEQLKISFWNAAGVLHRNLTIPTGRKDRYNYSVHRADRTREQGGEIAVAVNGIIKYDLLNPIEEKAIEATGIKVKTAEGDVHYAI